MGQLAAMDHAHEPDGALSLAHMRGRLRLLEADREIWVEKQRTRRLRLQLVQNSLQKRRPQTKKPATELNEGILTSVAQSSPPVEPMKEREDVTPRTGARSPASLTKKQELKALTMQLAKKQKALASSYTKIIQASTQTAKTTAVPSPPQRSRTPTPSPAPISSSPTSVSAPGSSHGMQKRGRNKLVLAPVAKSALGKRSAVGASTQQRTSVVFPPLELSEDISTGSIDERASIAFRLASRHFVQTGEKMTIALLQQKIGACIKNSVSNDEMMELVARSRPIQMLLLDPLAVNDATSAEKPHVQMVFRPHDAESIEGWIDAGKHLLNDMAYWWKMGSNGEDISAQLVSAMLTLTVAGFNDLDDVLRWSLCMRKSDSSATALMTAYPHISPILRRWQMKLTDKSRVSANRFDIQRSATSGTRSLVFSRPFDVENDSVMKQIHGKGESYGERPHKRRRTRRTDHMNVMCMFELNGVCNDPDCQYQHQRDFQTDGFEGEDQVDDCRASSLKATLVSQATRRTITQFIELRHDLRCIWPDLSSIMEATSKTPNRQRSDHRGESLECQDVETLVDDDIDYIELGSPMSISDQEEDFTSLKRYCNEEKESNDLFAVESLEDRVQRLPEDADAWLLLAVRYLNLEVTFCDDNVRSSDTSKVLDELYALHSILGEEHSVPKVDVDEACLVKCLSVLSRALEVEENAYKEELWLLHLRLSQSLTTNRDADGEIGMVEQALSFIPSSAALWRHYLALHWLCSDSVDDISTSSYAIIQAIARAAHQSQDQHEKDAFSVLLCDIVIQICASHCRAGVPHAATAFLHSLLIDTQGAVDGSVDADEDEEEASSRWRLDARNQIIGDDLLTLYVLFTQITISDDVPDWIKERGFGKCEAIDVYQMLLPLKSSFSGTTPSTWMRALDVCEAAFAEYGEQDIVPPGMEVLRHNWVVALAHCGDLDTNAKLDRIRVFTEQEYRRRVLLPRVISVLVSTFRDVLQEPDIAESLVRELMERYKTNTTATTETQRFGEAVHHYFLNEGGNHLDGKGFSSDFPSLKFFTKRFAGVLPCENPTYSNKAIKQLALEANPNVQHEGIVTLFHELLRDTLKMIVDNISGEGGQGECDDLDIAQDTYYLVAQAQVLGRVCGTSTAIEALDLIVIQGGSSKWSQLPRECRRLVWMTRLLLQIELYEKSTEGEPRELMQLFRLYLRDMENSVSTRRELGKSLLLSGRDFPDMRRAIDICLRKSISSPTAFDMDIFHTCLAALPDHERASQFASFHHYLSCDPRFLLSYYEHATQERDQQRALKSMRRMLMQDSTTVNPRVLDTVVLALIKLKNDASLVQVISHRMKANLFDRRVWEIAATLEMLFGSDEPMRAQVFTAVFAKAEGVRIRLRMPFPDDNQFSVPSMRSDAQVDMRSASLTHIPAERSLVTKSSLRYLDLRFNQLVTLPNWIGQLSQLRVLKLSGNALTLLPTGICLLANLEVLELAHNNLTEIQNSVWDGLQKLREVDLRYNALTIISPRVRRLQDLRVLKVVGNNFAWDMFQPVASVLPNVSIDMKAPSDQGNRVISELKDGGTAEQCARSADVVTEADMPTESVAAENGEKGRSEVEEDNSASDVIEISNESTPVGDDNNDEPTSESDVAGATGNGASTLTQENDSQTASSASPPTADGAGLDEGTESDSDEVEFLGSVQSPLSPAAAPRSPPPSEPFATEPEQPPSVDASRPQQHKSTARTQVIDRTSAEWRELVVRHLPEFTQYGPCQLCRAPNDRGTHQRLGLQTLCLRCLEDAVAVLRHRAHDQEHVHNG